MAILTNLVKTFWNYLREVSGENEYARYQLRMRAEGQSPLSRREFYDQRQRQKYSRPNRCC